MALQKTNFIGIIALLVATAYLIMRYDMDVAWYGYVDDFFVFIAGYSFFMGCRSKSPRARRLLHLIAGSFFIIGMLSLIALIVLA